MPSSDEEILRTSLKQPEAFGELVERHQRRVYGLIYRLAGPRDLDELYQQAWAKAFEARASFRGRSRFSTWLCGVAVNVVRARRREWVKQGRHEPYDDALHAPASSGGFFALARRQELETALDKLDAPLKEVLVLRYIEELELAEMAAVLGQRPNTLRVRLHRALKKIRSHVQKEG